MKNTFYCYKLELCFLQHMHFFQEKFATLFNDINGHKYLENIANPQLYICIKTSFNYSWFKGNNIGLHQLHLTTTCYYL